jgi:hypothetical protein
MPKRNKISKRTFFAALQGPAGARRTPSVDADEIPLTRLHTRQRQESDPEPRRNATEGRPNEVEADPASNHRQPENQEAASDRQSSLRYGYEFSSQ